MTISLEIFFSIIVFSSWCLTWLKRLRPFLSCRWRRDTRGPWCRTFAAGWQRTAEDDWCSDFLQTANRAAKSGQLYRRTKCRARGRIWPRRSSATTQRGKIESLFSDSRPCFRAENRLTKHSTRNRFPWRPGLRPPDKVLWEAPGCPEGHPWWRVVLRNRDRGLGTDRLGSARLLHFRLRFVTVVVVVGRRNLSEDYNVAVVVAVVVDSDASMDEAGCSHWSQPVASQSRAAWSAWTTPASCRTTAAAARNWNYTKRFRRYTEIRVSEI